MATKAVAGPRTSNDRSVLPCQASEVYAEAAGAVQEALSSIRTVAAFNMERAVQDKYAGTLRRPLKARPGSTAP